MANNSFEVIGNDVQTSLQQNIDRWVALENEYHEIIRQKQDAFIRDSGGKLRRKMISSEIIVCKDGIFIVREGSKHNADTTAVYRSLHVWYLYKNRLP